MMRRKAVRILKFITDRILTPAFWIFLIFGFDEIYIALLTILSALIHEGGHLLAAENGRIRGSFSGFRIRGGGLSYIHRILLLAMGPLANLAVFLLLLPFFGMGDGYIAAFGLVNLATAMSNLLPVEGYDGHGILTELLGMAGVQVPERIPNLLSGALTVVFTFFALYLMLAWDAGYWLFALFFVSLLTKLGKSMRQEGFS